MAAADAEAGGAQFDLDEFIKNLRWQPSFELGFDDGFNVEIGLYAVGGIETKFKSGNRFLKAFAMNLARA